MKWHRTALALGLIACTLAGGGAFASSFIYSRPVMPSFVVDATLATAGVSPPSFILIYDGRGSDPFRSGALGPGQRISACEPSGPTCTSLAARDELHLVRTRAQSVQVRLFNGHGNPIVGGARWIGPAYPKQVRLKCDLRIANVQNACAIVQP